MSDETKPACPVHRHLEPDSMCTCPERPDVAAATDEQIGQQLADDVIRQVCDLPPADPEHDETLCVKVESLHYMVKEAADALIDPLIEELRAKLEVVRLHYTSLETLNFDITHESERRIAELEAVTEQKRRLIVELEAITDPIMQLADGVNTCGNCRNVSEDWRGPGMCETHAARVATLMAAWLESRK